MNQQQFSALAAQGYNRIPIHRRILVDAETPVSSYYKLAHGAYSFLLESVQGGEKWGRYSIIGLPCKTRLQIKGEHIEVFENEHLIEQAQMADPLEFVAQYQARFNVAEVEDLPRFYGGLVGYFGYDCVRYVEQRLANSTPEDRQDLPDIVLMLAEEVLVFDNLSGVLHLIVLADPSVDDALALAEQRLEQLTAMLHENDHRLPLINLDNSDKSASAKTATEHDFVSSFGEQAFKHAVSDIREYILAGDCMQVVISQRLSIAFESEAFSLYRLLRHLNPSPYMYYLNLGEFEIVGASPEVLVRVEDQKVTVRPIAGTRRRGHDAAEDLAMEKELLSDPKELAEHLMLIDLGRNDVGRVSQVGSVELTEEYEVERYSHVMHIVSNVEGRLKTSLSSLDALRSILPAGTLSGAPKVRAMEIIDELEPVKRGVYGGAIGYLSWNGEMDTAIAIRTALIKDKQLHVQAGAGIVADSDPELEWKETMNKARAIFKAVEMLSSESNSISNASSKQAQQKDN